MLAAPEADRHAQPVHSNTLSAKAQRISDRKLPSDNKSLFHTVPFFKPFCGSASRFEACPLKRCKKHGKVTLNLGDGFVSVDYESGLDSRFRYSLRPRQGELACGEQSGFCGCLSGFCGCLRRASCPLPDAP
jgi:hypothetical protein